jgi:hypothetical protein
MNTLPLDKKLAVISALVEGNSIRSISRMTDVDRNTISSLLLRTGDRCAAILNERMRNLQCQRLQVDEIWTFVQKKRRRVHQGDSPEVGDQWVYVAIDADTRLIPSFYVLRRAAESHHENGNAPIHAPHERFFEETSEPEGRLRFALRAL